MRSPIVQRHGVPELLARVIAGRDVEADAVGAYLDPTLKGLMPDPDVLTDMAAAASRIADAMERGEQVAIFGDYDVDGATSAALLASFLRRGGLDPLIHIPDRIFEGYGPNVEAIRSLAERGARLLVTVDCGTTSLEPLAEAKRLGLDTVVIDHHQADEQLPDAIDRQSEPARRSLRSRPSRRRRAGVPHHRRGQPRAAPARLLERVRGRSPTSSISSISSRSAPSPTWCRSRGSTAPSSPRG